MSGNNTAKSSWNTSGLGNDSRARRSVDDIGLLAELVKADLRCRFAKGQTPAAADYLERFPELRAADSRVVSLVYEEYCLARRARARRPMSSRFATGMRTGKPHWSRSFSTIASSARRLACGRALPPFPEAGEEFSKNSASSRYSVRGEFRVFSWPTTSRWGENKSS